jgi:hypothetical protein
MSDEIDEFFLEITGTEDNTDFDPPSYKDRGMIVFEIMGLVEDYRGRLEYNIEVYDYDGAAFWMAEGAGIDYWFNDLGMLDEGLQPGFYVMEGVTGHYFRGDGWTQDDDEEFYFETLRYANEQEILAYGYEPTK